VPFYRRHWKQAGVDLTRVYSATHLEFLPVVTRSDLLGCPPEDRLDRRYAGQTLLGEQTCTPSGEAFEVPLDKRTQTRRRMRFWNALRDVGYIPGERLMLVSDTPMASGAALLRWTHADVALSDDALFAKCMNARPAVLCGPLSALTRLAARVVESRKAMWLPRLLVSTSEHLTDANRALLESTFRAKVADFYSTPELGLVAYSKPGLPGYQLLRDEFHVETLHSVGHRGGPERLLVTDLVPGAMPLIRFDTGDFAVPDLASSRALAPASILGFTAREPVRVDRKPRQVVAASGRERTATGLAGSSLPDVFAQGSI
jgi:phenylacetate-CoA ligase